MNSPKILFGVCGIGRGHVYEMLPIIENYVILRRARIVIFSFGESYRYFNTKYKNKKNVLIVKVKVPWIHGGPNGLDYLRTAKDKQNQSKDYIVKNFDAMEKVKEFLGKPDVVITDYEPISAMYAYSIGSKLITIDQQSKYLLSGYPSKIAGLTPNEECSRLGMFFPRADLRIINSFFRFPSNHPECLKDKYVTYGPIIRNDIVSIKNKFTGNSNDVLVYLSPYSPFVQDPEELLRIFKQVNDFRFHIFTSCYIKYKQAQKNEGAPNVEIRRYNEEGFLEALQTCRSVISSAGHTLLSELIFLGKPVLAVPLNTYEQHYSACVIDRGHYGMMAKRLSIKNIRKFLDSLDRYESSIETNGYGQLYRNPAQVKIIRAIDSIMRK